MKRLLNAIPIYLAALVITAGCTREEFPVEKENMSAQPEKLKLVWNNSTGGIIPEAYYKTWEQLNPDLYCIRLYVFDWTENGNEDASSGPVNEKVSAGAYIDKLTYSGYSQELTIEFYPENGKSYRILAVGMNHKAATSTTLGKGTESGNRWSIMNTPTNVINIWGISQLRATFTSPEHITGSQIYSGHMDYTSGKEQRQLSLTRCMAGIGLCLSQDNVPDGTQKIEVHIAGTEGHSQNQTLNLYPYIAENETYNQFGACNASPASPALLSVPFDATETGDITGCAFVMPTDIDPLQKTDNLKQGVSDDGDISLELCCVNEAGEVLQRYPIHLEAGNENSSSATYTLHSNHIYTIGTPGNPLSLPTTDDSGNGTLASPTNTRSQQTKSADSSCILMKKH